MKKIASALIVGLASASIASATITIEWKSSFGVDDPTIGVASPDLQVGSLVQLIWTPDATIGALDPLNPTAAQGNDIVIDSLFTAGVGGFATTGTYPDGAGPLIGVTEPQLLSGYVYIRVFNTAAPTVGDWYGESALVGNPLTDQDPSPSTPNVVDIAGSSFFTLNQQIVPEPSVLALAALGAAVVAIRRFRRS
ncbi:MAG TPA: PEP-CTERM sorting domain-containing protein [Kiritimatiellia bacterium]|nr:PEP-CTERM sorting domain-containing protein [Kiritimatiellia bacterium]